MLIPILQVDDGDTDEKNLSPSTSNPSTPVPIPTGARGRSGATGAALAAASGALARSRPAAAVKSSARAISARPTSAASPAQSSIPGKVVKIHSDGTVDVKSWTAPEKNRAPTSDNISRSRARRRRFRQAAQAKYVKALDSGSDSDSRSRERGASCARGEGRGRYAVQLENAKERSIQIARTGPTRLTMTTRCPTPSTHRVLRHTDATSSTRRVKEEFIKSLDSLRRRPALVEEAQRRRCRRSRF